MGSFASLQTRKTRLEIPHNCTLVQELGGFLTLARLGRSVRVVSSPLNAPHNHGPGFQGFGIRPLQTRSRFSGLRCLASSDWASNLANRPYKNQPPKKTLSSPLSFLPSADKPGQEEYLDLVRLQFLTGNKLGNRQKGKRLFGLLQTEGVATIGVHNGGIRNCHSRDLFTAGSACRFRVFGFFPDAAPR